MENSNYIDYEHVAQLMRPSFDPVAKREDMKMSLPMFLRDFKTIYMSSHRQSGSSYWATGKAAECPGNSLIVNIYKPFNDGLVDYYLNRFPGLAQPYVHGGRIPPSNFKLLDKIKRDKVILKQIFIDNMVPITDPSNIRFVEDVIKGFAEVCDEHTQIYCL